MPDEPDLFGARPAPTKMKKWADIDGEYRYVLGREWDPSKPRLMILAHNPSTASAESEDPTSARFLGYTRAWGFGSYEALNPWALMATDKDVLKKHKDPVGPRNMTEIISAASRTHGILLCTGSVWKAGQPHAWRVITMLAQQYPLYGLAEPYEDKCILTSDGFPIHPLYKPARLVPCRFRGPR